MFLVKYLVKVVTKRWASSPSLFKMEVINVINIDSNSHSLYERAVQYYLLESL